MKIVSPLSNINELNDIIREGPDEIYFGMLGNEWLTQYTNVISMNSREFRHANTKSIEEVNIISKVCRRKNIKTSFTLNSPNYSSEQLEYIKTLLKKIKVDNVIVADIGLIQILNTQFPNFDIHISTLAAVLNVDAIHFFKDLGASRIIMPRHLRIQEILQMRKDVKHIELEIFCLNQSCINIDGFCTYLHGIKEMINPKTKFSTKDSIADSFSKLIPIAIQKRLRYLLETSGGCACRENYKISDGNKVRYDTYNPHVKSGVKCAACALKKLQNSNNIFLKIVGREYSTEKKLKDLLFLKNVVKELYRNESSYLQFCRRVHQKTFQEKCTPIKCYYQKKNGKSYCC